MEEESWRRNRGGGIHLRFSPLAFDFGWFGDSILRPLGSAASEPLGARKCRRGAASETLGARHLADI